MGAEHMPLKKEEAEAQGFNWKDEEEVRSEKSEVRSIPTTIAGVSDDICKEVLTCDSCFKQYKITGMELEFYKKMNLPLPTKDHNCRHYDRIKLRNPIGLWERNCDKCSTSIHTSYSSDRPEKVYCEKCYLDSVE